MFTSPTIPHPEPEALAHSEQLRHQICAAIARQGGKIAFDQYMQMALYEPGLGYYNCGTQKFGGAGDFVTAPEISPLFSRCLARQCQQILQELRTGNILEFGAGSGVMARDILTELASQNCLPEHYYILEISADLKQRQQQMLANAIPELFSRITWLESLPQQFCGVILANEVVDAFPVKLFLKQDNQLQEYFVSVTSNQLCLQADTLSDSALFEHIPSIALPNNYQSEINPLISPWLNTISGSLTQGALLLIDYGFPRHEYYHPQRSQGTLMCHYRHRCHSDPFFMPGLQDITAHVDFTALAEAAADAELHVAGYNTQAGFLLGCGLMQLITDTPLNDVRNQVQLNQQIQRLTSPAEMGELFKVMALTRNFEPSLIGFKQQDLRGKLL